MEFQSPRDSRKEQKRRSEHEKGLLTTMTSVLKGLLCGISRSSFPFYWQHSRKFMEFWRCFFIYDVTGIKEIEWGIHISISIRHSIYEWKSKEFLLHFGENFFDFFVSGHGFKVIMNEFFEGIYWKWKSFLRRILWVT